MRCGYYVVAVLCVDLVRRYHTRFVHGRQIPSSKFICAKKTVVVNATLLPLFADMHTKYISTRRFFWSAVPFWVSCPFLDQMSQERSPKRVGNTDKYPVLTDVVRSLFLVTFSSIKKSPSEK